MDHVRRGGPTILAILVVSFVLSVVHARELTLAQRIACERQVERVYWQHRLWPAENPGVKPELEDVLTDDALRTKVESSLRASSALATWGRGLTSADLQNEMNRMARETHRPEMLGEIFAALDDDPFLIAECLVRPILADRRLGELAGQDAAFATWWDEEGVLQPAQVLPAEDVFVPVALASTTACSNDTWTPTNVTGAPRDREDHVSIWTGSEVLVWGGFTIIGSLQASLRDGKFYDPATNSWRQYPPTGPFGYTGGYGLSAVWTGTEMIVWGGGSIDLSGPHDNNKGARYNPASNVWVETSTAPGVPSARIDHAAVWTGSRMIVWGGENEESNTILGTGGVYDPVSDSWMPTNNGSLCALGPQQGHGCQDDGQCPGTCNGGASPGQSCTENMDCLGGCHNDPSVRCAFDGLCQSQGLGLCNAPVPGSCSNLGSCTSGAYHPTARSGHTGVWTGGRMIVWGGTADSSGGIYDPVMDTWSPTSLGANVPSPRSRHVAVWTGTQMIVWGGSSNTGGRYDPALDTWTPTSTAGAVPQARSNATAVWTGDEMIVWGGNGLNTGGRYRPATDIWTATTLSGVPVGRTRHSASWTGDRMVVWGGFTSNGFTNTGGSYCASPSCTVHTWYHDADGDGHGVTSNSVLACSQPPGYAAASGDCNDASPSVHPGLAEICGDGLDNDCSGAADDAVPLAGSSVMSVSSGGGTVSWTPLAGANGYDVVRGSLALLASSHGDFTLATQACLANDLASTSVSDASIPSAGQGLWYLVRGENCAGPGTYDSGAGSQSGSRDAEIQASASACP